MTTIRAYHRPTTLDEALALLARPGVETVPLGGGTVLNGLPSRVPDEVVDLQALGLDGVQRNGSTLAIGATVTLQQLIDHEWTPQVLRDLARAEAPNTIRNAATLGGTVAAADAESGVLAGLVALNASIIIVTGDGSSTLSIDDVLADRSKLAGGLITEVRIELGGEGASAGTARTPADTPIVLVVGHRAESGAIRLAATGVAATPVLLDPAAVDHLDPPADFRGSAEYRRHLAQVLAARVEARLSGGGGA